ncbi:hypothetical protein AB0L39_33495 [Streptomyces parvus]|uniref:hypothetical protein n=1 Tax=Streptomyces parvus TaxID=66428 RepID=UPI003440BECC
MRVRTALATTALAAAAVRGNADLATAADPEPVNPLAVSADTLLDFERNGVGTPFGQWEPPQFSGDLSGS